jgi:hypothetical protein
MEGIRVSGGRLSTEVDDMVMKNWSDGAEFMRRNRLGYWSGTEMGSGRFSSTGIKGLSEDAFRQGHSPVLISMGKVLGVVCYCEPMAKGPKWGVRHFCLSTAADALWRNTSSGVVGRLVPGGLWKCVLGDFRRSS